MLFRRSELKRWSILSVGPFLVILFYFHFSPSFVASQRPEVWFAPLQPVLRPDGSYGGLIDYFDLFKPNADWVVSAQAVRVFKIYPEILRSASDDELRSVVKGLTARQIKLALEAPVLVSAGRCGFRASPWLPDLVRRLKNLGGHLSEFAMVGPLVDGRNPTTPDGCHSSVDEVATVAAAAIANIQRYYPEVLVGEIEPLGKGPNFPDWDELDTWLEVWKRVSGQNLRFLHIDTSWGFPWQDDMRKVARKARDHAIHFGVIYKGERTDLSDASFVASGLANSDEVETVLNGAPDQVVLQSWEDYPRHALPDSDLTTMTGFLRAYLRMPTQLTLANSAGIKLTRKIDADPVSDVPLELQMHDPAPEKALQARVIAGTVPHGAVAGLFALRVHSECICRQDMAHLLLTGLKFDQRDANQHFYWDLGPWLNGTPGITRQTSGDGEVLLRADLPAAQQVLLNGPIFPVAADHRFIVSFKWQIEPRTEDTGSLAIIFLDKTSHEIRRVPQVFRTSWVDVTMLRTGPDGTALLPKLHSSPGATLRVRFAGNLEYRGATLTLGNGYSKAAP